MQNEKITYISAWRDEFSSKRFRRILISSVFILVSLLFSLTQFLNYVEAREGVLFNDPILKYFTATDLTWVIFGIIYLSLIAAVFSLLPHPKELLFAVQLYALMVFVRIVAMYLLPLNPPEGMIELKDPFVEFFGTGTTLTKDLFFSGHTASLLIFFFTAKNMIFKIIFLILLILIAILVVLQKVHYTIDVYAALFFTTASYFILKAVKQKFNI
jgi:hypothetical protein